jgi:hypothetical protein
MDIVPANLGFSVADGEHVEVTFANGDLLLRFVDWREQPVEARFTDALAFRWASRPSFETPRDDSTYEFLGSTWLDAEVRFEGLSYPGNFAHYVLCFNASKVLEIIARRRPP